MIILGIETSCDETAAAITANGAEILSSVVSTQEELHSPYGGVVPELASRKHVEAIIPVVNKALNIAGLNQSDINAIAVTQGPGLIGALLVGFNFAKAFAYASGIPFIGVNHLEGHINSIFLENPRPCFPFVTLLASGGHTGIYYVQSFTSYKLMGQTLDDAAGEAFYKAAKALGLGYPGGNAISKMASKGDPSKIVFTRPYLDKSGFDFSFSGIKTAVKRYIQTHSDYQKHIFDIAAGFEEAITDVLSYKIIGASKETGCDSLAVVGGVAANLRLREKVESKSKSLGIKVYFPSISFCGDNAAMIAAAGYHHLIKGESSGITDDVYSRSPYKKFEI